MLGRVFGIFLKVRIKPTTFIQACRGDEGRSHFPIVTWLKTSNFFFAFKHDRQGRCLHTPHWCFKKSSVLTIKGGHSTRAIDAHQPIRFSTGARSRLEGLHRGVRTQILKGVSNRVLRHRLQPEALHGFFLARILFNVAKN